MRSCEKARAGREREKERGGRYFALIKNNGSSPVQLCSSRAITAPESEGQREFGGVRELNVVDDEIVVPPNRLN